MATFKYTNAYLSINNVDLSDHVKSCDCNWDAEMLDDSAMGDSDKNYIPGVKGGIINVEFKQDHAAGSVDATIWGAYNGGTAVAVIFKPNSSTTAVTNPKWTGNVLIPSYNHGGAHGSLASATVTLQFDGAATRATSD